MNTAGIAFRTASSLIRRLGFEVVRPGHHEIHACKHCVQFRAAEGGDAPGEDRDLHERADVCDAFGQCFHLQLAGDRIGVCEGGVRVRLGIATVSKSQSLIPCGQKRASFSAA